MKFYLFLVLFLFAVLQETEAVRSKSTARPQQLTIDKCCRVENLSEREEMSKKSMKNFEACASKIWSGGMYSLFNNIEENAVIEPT